MKNESHDRRNRWSGFKVRSLITLVLVFSIMIPIPIFSTAAENTAPGNTAAKYSPTVKFDPSKTCSLVVAAYDAENTDEDYSDLGVADMVIDLYKVADAVPYDRNDGYTFTVADSFKDLETVYKDKDVIYKDKDGELHIKTDINAAEWRALSQEAAKIVLDASTGTAMEGMEPDIKSAPIAGEITIEEPGLYLMVARNADDYRVAPPENEYVFTTKDGYVVTIKDEDTKEDNIATRVFTYKNRYLFLPELVSLPTKLPDEYGDVNTANQGDWIYVVNVNLKPQRENASLKIVKEIDYFVDGRPVTFVFSVVAEVDGIGVVYDAVHSIIFDGSETEMVREVIIDGIPVGAKVTVTEEYSGTGYTVVSDGDGVITKDIDANLWYVRFEFENNYDGRQTSGYGITNHFSFDENENEWQWNPIEDESQR